VWTNERPVMADADFLLRLHLCPLLGVLSRLLADMMSTLTNLLILCCGSDFDQRGRPFVFQSRLEVGFFMTAFFDHPARVVLLYFSGKPV
jgi:hypothetical protein